MSKAVDVSTVMLLFHMLFPGMRVYVRLAAHLRGRVGGLCGNFDGNTENDFTTRQGIVESTPELFGNSWKVSPSCPDVADQDLRDPCAVSSDTDTHTQTHPMKINLAHTHDTWTQSDSVMFSWTPTEWHGLGRSVQSWLRNSSLGATSRCLSSSTMTGVSLMLVGEWLHWSTTMVWNVFKKCASM